MYSDYTGQWVITIGMSVGVACVLGINFFASILVDSSKDFGLFIGATLLYGITSGWGLSISFGFYWRFNQIQDYLNAITVSFAAGYCWGLSLVYNYYRYPDYNKKWVGIQISNGSYVYRETAPFDGGIYIPLRKIFKNDFASCGTNSYKLLRAARKFKIKIWRV